MLDDECLTSLSRWVYRWLSECLSQPTVRAQRIEKVDGIAEVLLVVCHHEAGIHGANGSDDHIQGASGLTPGGSFRHQLGPHQGCGFIEREHPVPEQRLRPTRAGEPVFEFALRAPLRHLENAAPDLSERQAGDKQILISLVGHPLHQRSRRCRLDGIWLLVLAIAVVTLVLIELRPVTAAHANGERFAAFMAVGALFCLGYPSTGGAWSGWS
jgi:hypothetical protein